MTAGGGVSHSEEATGHYRGELDGIQLWVAQPDLVRNGAPAFEHHTEIPSVDIDGGVAAVFVGEFMDVVSPARRDTPLVGVDLALGGGPVTMALRPDWEYALVIMHEQVNVDGGVLTPGHLAYLGLGRDELRIDAYPGARVVLLGGEPFDESIVMWWNFVARDRAELEAAYRSWQDDDGRFGRFTSPLRRIPAPTPYWTQPPS
jgi:redox-sensitive bicupin YhaK (pirin superfamily)